jgi:hypothetical protein
VLPHRVTFTGTDLTKAIGHTTGLVVWDVDEDQGQVVESEVAFFAQDDRANVWSLGEYPEEFEEGAFVGAPSTWFARRRHAVPGVIVRGDPTALRARELFLEGFAPRSSSSIAPRCRARTTRSVGRACAFRRAASTTS